VSSSTITMKSVFIVCLLAIVVLAAEANLGKRIFKRQQEPYRIARCEFQEYMGCKKRLSDEFYEHMQHGMRYRWADICPYAVDAREVLRNESIRHECDTEEIMVYFDEHVSAICDHVIPDKVWYEMDCDVTGDFDYRPAEFDDAPEKICDDPETIKNIGCRVLKEAKDRGCSKDSFPHIGMGLAIFNQVYCQRGNLEPVDLKEVCQQSGGASDGSGDGSGNGI
ncbi:unnamed protein product, partial [Owenia fusiformis]